MWTLPKPNPRLVAIAFLASLALLTLWIMPELDADFVETAVAYLGPVAIVLLVALGIVVSPIPSGAIALVAGAIYGTVMGGALTVAGAVLGAAGAFLLSRYFGRGHVMAMDNKVARLLTQDRSQNGLTAMVFVTRLIPFISFDAVSYVAGLTPLRVSRFLAATALGTTPVCIAFAHAGATARSGEMHPMVLIGLTGITLVLPALVIAARALSRRAPGFA